MGQLTLSRAVVLETAAVLLVGFLGRHAIVLLVLLASLLIDDELAWALNVPGKHGAKHDEAGVGCECLGAVSRVDCATIRDDVASVSLSGGSTLSDGTELGVANSSLEPGRTGGTRADTDFDHIDLALVDKLVEALWSHHIACHEDHVRHHVPQLITGLDKTVKISVGNVNADHLDLLAKPLLDVGNRAVDCLHIFLGGATRQHVVVSFGKHFRQSLRVLTRL